MEAQYQPRGPPPPPPLLSLPSSSSLQSSTTSASSRSPTSTSRSTSISFRSTSNPHNPQFSRIQSFHALLDPQDLMPGHTVSDLYALRHLTRASGGLPESGSSHDWLRPVAWKVLLGFIPVEKKEWGATLAKRREEYYQFLSDLLPSPSSSSSDPDLSLPGSLSERDNLLDQIYKDLSRSRKNAFAFYSEELPCEEFLPPESYSDPPSELSYSKDSQGCRKDSETRSKIAKQKELKRNLLKRLSIINKDYSTSLDQNSSTPIARKSSLKGKEKEVSTSASIPTSTTDPNLLSTTDGRENEVGSESPHIYLSPPSPNKKAGPSGSSSSISSALEGDDSLDNQNPISRSRNFDLPSDFKDVRWHSLLRILYIYALLNPSTGYIQGMNEVAFVILYVLGNVSKSQRKDSSSTETTPTSTTIDSKLEEDGDGDGDLSTREKELESGALHDLNAAFHSEADAFWCFSALIGEVRELYEFDEIDHKEAGLRITNSRSENPDGILDEERRRKGETGMAGALKRFSRRLFWLDEELWQALKVNSLDPRLPYYSFRWLACLVSTELSLPSLVRVWDALLTEESGPAQPDLETNSKDQGDGSAKIEFLIDLCCALLINIRGPLLDAITPSSTDATGEDSFGSSGEAFAKAIHILQDYPDEDIQPVVELAYIYRQRRLASGLTGDGPPIDDALLDQAAGNGGTSTKEKISAALRGWTGNTPQASPNSSYPGLGSNSSTPIRPGLVNGSRTPSGASRWFSTVGRSASASPNLSSDQYPQTPPLPSAELATPGSGSTTGGSRMLSRYAEALQSSDAAASLSKTSSNWMASWSNRGNPVNHEKNNASPTNSSRTSTPSRPALPSSFSSAIGVGSEFLKKVRSASGSESNSNNSNSSASNHHPASFRWSRDVTPDFPLPNVLDSPDGRTEYFRPRPESGIVYSRNPSTSSPHHPIRPSSPTPGSEGGVPSPTLSSNGISSPNLLPSMRSAQQARTGSALRGAGPKPLLLGGSARPPREGSGSMGLPPLEETRRVSSGPLAAAASSPEARASAKTRRLSSLSNTSHGTSSMGSHHQRVGTGSSSTTNGNGYSSRRSSIVSSRDSNNGDGDSSTIASVASSAISVEGARSGEETSMPKLLPSMAAALQANGTLPQPLASPPTSHSNAASSQSLGLQGNGNGKVSAGAFRAVNGDPTSSQISKAISTPPSAWQDPHSQRSSYPSSTSSSSASPNVDSTASSTNRHTSPQPQPIPFGQVSSSSDTPLVPAASASIKSRKPVRRKASAGSTSEREISSPVSEKGVGLGFNGVVPTASTTDTCYFPDKSSTRISNSPRGSVTSISSDKKSSSNSLPNSNRVSVFEAPRPAPTPPSNPTSTPSQGPTKIRSGTRKYALTDVAPVPIEKDDHSEAQTNNKQTRDSLSEDQDVPIDASSINGGGKGSLRSSRGSGSGSGSGITRSRRTTQESIKSLNRDSRGSLTRKSNPISLSSSSSVAASAPSGVSPGPGSTLEVMKDGSLSTDPIPPPSPGPSDGDVLTADQLLRTLTTEAEGASKSDSTVMMERRKALGVPADLNDDDDEEEDFMAGHDAGLEGIGNTLALADSDPE